MRIRGVTSILLAMFGALAVVVGIVLSVADHSLFDEQMVEDTTRTIVQDRDVDRLLTREVTNRVVEIGGLEAQRDQVEPVVALLLADDRVHDAVTAAVMASYDSLLNRPDEVISLNLVSIAEQVRGQAVVAVPGLDQQLPPAEELLRFELLRRDDLPRLFDVIDTVRIAGWWMLVGGIVCVMSALLLGPRRFGVFAMAAGTMVVGMFLAATWITTASDNAIDSIEDPLSRRVARLATDGYLSNLDHVSIAVVIFGTIAVIAGIGGSWIKNAARPPKPRPIK